MSRSRNFLLVLGLSFEGSDDSNTTLLSFYSASLLTQNLPADERFLHPEDVPLGKFACVLHVAKTVIQTGVVLRRFVPREAIIWIRDRWLVCEGLGASA